MIKLLFNIFIIPCLYFISILPFWILFGLSNVLYYIIFYVFSYRKKVVLDNLRKSFPEKSEREINKISKEFYRHFCDIIFETIKLLTISIPEFKKRCALNQEDLDLFNHFFNKQQSFVGVMGHCGNWEWAAIAHQFYFKSLITGVYHPLSNKNFDSFMLKLRGRLGGNIIPMSRVYKELLILREKKIMNTLGLIADQTPPPESAYWTKFLNQDTAIFFGAEKIAKKFDYPVIFLSNKKVKRGYYQLSAHIITENPKKMNDGEITELHVKQLEKDINSQPFNWLWSHKRWKHKKPILDIN